MIRASVKDPLRIRYSDLTGEGRHVAGTVLTNEELADIITAENGFFEQAVYTGDYLNQTEPSYRGMDLHINRSDGMNTLVIGANGIGASAEANHGGMPVSQAIDQTINIALSNGVTKSVALQGGDAASEVAENLNEMLQNLGIRAKKNCVELFGLSASGTVSFKIEGDNRTPIEILIMLCLKI